MTLWSSADFGTNTFRLLIAEEVAPGRLVLRELHQHVVRLGEGLTPGGRLGETALARAEALLARFRERLEILGVERRLGAVTAAGRVAVDGPAFAARAGELLGAAVRILSGDEEARLSALGGLSLVDAAGRDTLFLDIGGGSTEVVAASARGVTEVAVSLPLGVVSLWEALRPCDPPTPKELAALDDAATAGLAPLDCSLDRIDWRARLGPGGGMVLATAGTALTIAAHVHGRPIGDTRALSGLCVSRVEVEAVWREFSALTAARRRALPSVEPGREDVILAGLAVLRGFLDRLGAAGMTVTDGGLLEGVLVQAVREARGEASWAQNGSGKGREAP